MKRPTPQIPLILLFLTSFFLSNAQVQEWQSIQNFPDARSGAVSFVIGETAYVGTGSSGSSYLKTFYKYTAADASWSSVNDFPGAAREGAVAFVADGKAYVGSGSDGSTQFKDFFEYDPSTGNWTAIADLPGEIRNEASSFSINDKGYVGLGGNDTGSLNDFYEYDPATGSWTAIAYLPASEARSKAVGFATDGKGFIASGVGSQVFTGMYSYDPVANSWSEEIFADSKLNSLQQNTTYTDSEGLVHILNSGFTKEQVIIDPTDNSLTTDDAYFTDERNSGVAFYLSGEAYAGLGYTSKGFDITYQNDFRKLVTIYPPEAPTDLRSYNYDNLIRWEDNSNDDEGFIIYLSENHDSNFTPVDTVTRYWRYYSFYPEYTFDSLKYGIKQYIKVAAYNRGGIAESNVISYYPIYESARIYTPKLLDISENQDDSLDIEFNYTYVSNDLNIKAIVERSYDGVNYETVFQRIQFRPDTVSLRHDRNLSFTKQVGELFFRVKLTANGRTDSEYSNVMKFNTDELKPVAPTLRITEKPDDDQYFYEIYGDSFNHTDSVMIYGIKGDTVYFEQEAYESLLENNEILETFEMEPNDSIVVYAVTTNVFGKDTSQQILVKSPKLPAPKFKSNFYNNINAIELSFTPNIEGFTGYTVIERVKKGGKDFNIIDSVLIDGSNDEVRYVDSNVEPNDTYLYRLKNIKVESSSLYNEPLELKSEKMARWEIFRKNSLNSVMDSLETFKITNVNYFENNIYFLSNISKKFFRFDLESNSLESLRDVLSGVLEEGFSDVELIDNKLFYFKPYKYDDNLPLMVYIYNLKNNDWEVREIEIEDTYIPEEDLILSGNYGVAKSKKYSDSSILLSIKYANHFSSSSSIALYDLNSMDITRGDEYIDIPEVTNIDASQDSILIFGKNYSERDYPDKIISVAHNLMTEYGNYDNIGQIIYKRMITEHQNELIFLSNNNIYNLDFSEKPYLSNREASFYETKYYIRDEMVFTYQDTLVYFSQPQNYPGSFHYKNEKVPGNLLGLNADTVTHNALYFSWLDNPDETAYVVKVYEYYSSSQRYLTREDTLKKDVSNFKLDSLKPNYSYVVDVIPINESGINGKKAELFFRTKDAKPNPPVNLKWNKISTEQFELSWQLKDSLNLVDSLSINDSIIAKTDDSQSFIITKKGENQPVFAELFTFNQWIESSVVNSDTIYTYLFSPEISQIEFYEKEEKYNVLIKSNSVYANYFELYRKSSSSSDFELVGSLDGEFEFQNFIDDISVEYDYYVEAFLKEEDSIINSSYPSDTVSTISAILSNTPLQSDEVSIFPNPVNDHLYISSDLNVQLQQVQVLSLEGRLLNTLEASEIIDVSELEKGIYLLKIKAKSGEVIKRFIKE